MAVNTSERVVSEENNSKHFTCRFEDALTLTGFGRYNFYMTIVCGMIAIALATDNFGFNYTLQASQCDLKLTLTQRGWLGATPSIGSMSTSIVWGYLADTQGRRRILIPAMFLSSACSIISSFAPTLPIFAVLKLCSSTFVSAVFAACLPYFSEFTPKKNLGSMIFIWASIFVACSAVSSLIAWGVLSLDFRIPIDFLGIEYRPWRLMIVCFSSLFILAALILLKASESPKYLMVQGKNDEALKILQKMYAINTGNKESDFPVKELILDEMEVLCIKSESLWHSIVDQTAPLFKPPFLTLVLKFLVISFGIGWCADSFFIWLPDILDRFYFGYADGVNNKNFCELMAVRSDLRHNNATNDSESSEVCVVDLETSTYTFTMMISGLNVVFHLALAGVLRIASKKVVLLTILSMDCIFSFSMEWIHNEVLICIGVLLYLFSGSVINITNTYAVELIPAKLKSMTICLIGIFCNIGSMTGVNLVGYLIETNCSLNFYLYGAVLSVCLISSIFLPTTKRADKKISEIP